MKKLLIDTSVIIDFLRRKDKQNTPLFRLASEDLYISVIAHTELYAGKSIWMKKEAEKELEDVFSGITILPLIEEISKQAGYLKVHYPNSTLIDCLIAATSIYHKLELATLNIKDFEPVKEVKLYAFTLSS